MSPTDKHTLIWINSGEFKKHAVLAIDAQENTIVKDADNWRWRCDCVLAEMWVIRTPWHDTYNC